MNDVPRESLKRIVAQFGAEVAQDARRVEALLRDFCGAYRREIFVLVSALEEGIVADLETLTGQLPYSVVLPRLAAELHETTALSEEAARWAVDVWAEALGLVAQGAAVGPPTQGRAVAGLGTSGLELIHRIAAHSGGATDIAFSARGPHLASVGMDASACIWEITTAREVAVLRQQTGVLTSVAWHPDGLSLALGSADFGIYLWPWTESGGPIPRLRGHAGGVMRTVFHPDGERLVSGARDSEIYVWDASTGEVQTTLQGHTAAVTDLALSPDGRTLASAGGWDRTVCVWDLPQAQMLWSLTGHTAQVTGVSFDGRGRALASGGWDEVVRLWDLKQGRERVALRQKGEALHMVSAVAVSPDGGLVAAGDWQGTIRLWDPGRRQLVGELTDAGGRVHRVVFSPRGDWVASADASGTVCLWRRV